MQGINSDPINAQELHKIIFEELNETNIEIMTKKLWNYSNKKPISFYLYVCKIVYFAYAYRQKEINVCIEFLKKIYMLENDSSKSKKMQDKFITDYFSDLMLLINTQESKYFLEAMINNNMKTEDIFIHQLVIPRFFSHYNQGERHYFSSSMHDKYFKKNLDKLKKNNWELHKQLIKEGVNPNELAKIIRNDEIEKLQEISSQNDFDFNQIIRRSIYERHSFINQKMLH